MPGDGNCMFSSLANQLGRLHSTAAAEVRAELVEYMEANPQMVSISVNLVTFDGFKY